MIDPHSLGELRSAIRQQVEGDRTLLDDLRREVQALKGAVKNIQPRSTTSISLVGTDGGNNQLQFDPFLVQLIRVVDSSNNEYCLEVVSPTTSVTALSRQQFESDGKPRTALGKMMSYLGVDNLTKLSVMIRTNDDDRPVSPSWVQVYRELVEWAILFTVLREKDFGTDTIVICDGLLRSKVFSGELFKKYLLGLQEGIEAQFQRSKRRLFLAGVSKSSKVLDRYRLVMALEGILATDYPAYVEVPRSLEEKAYIWSEYARGDDRAIEGGEVNKFVGGKMFFVKFGGGRRDPVWPIDIFLPQSAEAQTIIGCMLADAINGFPVPFYPQCLQKAHENAALVDFDFDILQDEIFGGIRSVLGEHRDKLDVFRLRDQDPAARRYS
ncbi:MAG TPA: hypothetical protein VNP98_09560 [Chthoniobacterales bacterium]|nr:hypothetical protein [Chthoniobacterales bacterium]